MESTRNIAHMRIERERDDASREPWSSVNSLSVRFSRSHPATIGRRGDQKAGIAVGPEQFQADVRDCRCRARAPARRNARPAPAIRAANHSGSPSIGPPTPRSARSPWRRSRRSSACESRAQQPRGGLHADQRVVFLVLVGVDRVVAQRPEEAGGIENEGRAWRGCRSAPRSRAARPS